MMRKTLLLLVLLLGLLAARTACCEGLTMMIYMTGSDLETRGAVASEDIDEMIRSMPEDASLHVVLLTGGANVWHKPGVSADGYEMWEVTADGLSSVCRLTGGSMGEADLLRQFLLKSTEQYPADQYALILWDHGGGPLGGVCFDEPAGMEALSLDALAEALEAGGFREKPLMLIGFDACLMASAEVAASMAPFSEYMVASEEPEPAQGWDYAFLKNVTPGLGGEGLARLIAGDYMASAGNSPAPITLSCVRLSEAALLNRELDHLFSGMKTALDPAMFEKMSFCRTDVKVLGSALVSRFDLVDLGDFLDEIDAAGLGDVRAARQALDRMIVFSSANEDFISGLSVYYPFDNKAKFTHPWSAQYSTLSFSEGYKDWVQASSAILLGDSLFDWRDTRRIKTRSQALKAMVQCDLSGEEAAQVTEAELIVLEEAAAGEYRLVWRSSDTEIRGGRLTAAYHGQALYALDSSGSVCAGPLSWREVAGGIAVGALLEHEDGKTESVYLIFHEDGQGAYDFYEVDAYNSGLGMFVPSAQKINPGNSLIFASWTRVLPEADALYEDWPYGESMAVEPLVVPDGGLKLRMLPLTGADRRIALFELHDVQNNIHLTAPSELPDMTSIRIADSFGSRSGRHITMTLKGMTLFNNAAQGLQIELVLQNRTGQQVTATAAAVVMDDAVLSDWRRPQPVTLDAAEETALSILIPARALQRAQIAEAGRMAIIVQSTAEDDTKVEDSFPFDVGVSFALLGIPEEEAVTPLATAETAGVSAELIRYVYDSSAQCLKGEILLKNSTDTALTVQAAEVWVNGAEAYGNLCEGTLPLTIPPACHSRCFFTVWPNDPVTNKPIPSVAEEHDVSVFAWKLRCGSGDMLLTFNVNPGHGR